MLHRILVAIVLLGSSSILGSRYSEVEQTMQKIRERSNWLEEVTNSSTISSNCNYQRVDLKKIIASAVSVLDFFDKHLEELVIDAAIGTRVMECK